MERELCGKWMPRAKTTCARGTGHKGQCRTAAFLQSQREYNRQRRAENPELTRELQREYQRKHVRKCEAIDPDGFRERRCERSRNYRRAHHQQSLERDREYKQTAAGILSQARSNAKRRGSR